jgi:NDP-sugar pyrophosphorylase family protein
MPERRAVIVAGGQGTRLRPFTFVIPKALIPIGESPIIEILLRQLAHHGFTNVSMAVGRNGALLESYCGDGSQFGVAIDYLREDEPLGTAGSLGSLGPVEDDRILVVNGDTLTDIDFDAVYRRHKTDDAMTVVAQQRDVALRFGIIDKDETGRLADYSEKPVFSYDAGMGIYVVATHAISRHLPDPEPIDMPQLIRRLLDAGETISVFDSDDYWLDVGHIDDLEAAMEAIVAEPRRFLPDKPAG